MKWHFSPMYTSVQLQCPEPAGDRDRRVQLIRVHFSFGYTLSFFSVAKKFVWLLGPPAYTTVNLHPKGIPVQGERRNDHMM